MNKIFTTLLSLVIFSLANDSLKSQKHNNQQDKSLSLSALNPEINLDSESQRNLQQNNFEINIIENYIPAFNINSENDAIEALVRKEFVDVGEELLLVNLSEEEKERIISSMNLGSTSLLNKISDWHEMGMDRFVDKMKKEFHDTFQKMLSSSINIVSKELEILAEECTETARKLAEKGNILEIPGALAEIIKKRLNPDNLQSLKNKFVEDFKPIVKEAMSNIEKNVTEQVEFVKGGIVHAVGAEGQKAFNLNKQNREVVENISSKAIGGLQNQIKKLFSLIY